MLVQCQCKWAAKVLCLVSNPIPTDPWARQCLIESHIYRFQNLSISWPERKLWGCEILLQQMLEAEDMLELALSNLKFSAQSECISNNPAYQTLYRHKDRQLIFLLQAWYQSELRSCLQRQMLVFWSVRCLRSSLRLKSCNTESDCGGFTFATPTVKTPPSLPKHPAIWVFCVCGTWFFWCDYARPSTSQSLDPLHQPQPWEGGCCWVWVSPLWRRNNASAACRSASAFH